jgi:hypothetical protein
MGGERIPEFLHLDHGRVADRRLALVSQISAGCYGVVATACHKLTVKRPMPI